MAELSLALLTGQGDIITTSQIINRGGQIRGTGDGIAIDKLSGNGAYTNISVSSFLRLGGSFSLLGDISQNTTLEDLTLMAESTLWLASFEQENTYLNIANSLNVQDATLKLSSLSFEQSPIYESKIFDNVNDSGKLAGILVGEFSAIEICINSMHCVDAVTSEDWDISALYSDGTIRYLGGIAAVPIPTSIWLFGSACLLLLRRKNEKPYCIKLPEKFIL